MILKGYIIALAVMSVIAFATYGSDKKRAVEGEFRTPERLLLLLAFLGGGLGAFLGMQVFHHKTRKPRFQFLVPVALAIQLIILVILIMNS